MQFGCFATIKDIETLAQAGFDFAELNLREIIALGEAEFQQVLSRMKTSGLDADVISWILPSDLDLTSADTCYEDWRSYIALGIRRSLALGATRWPIGNGWSRCMKPENGPEELQQQRLRAFFSELARQTAEAGIRLLMEPLGPDYSNYLLTLEETADFAASLPGDNVAIVCDLRHLTRSGVPLSDIEKYADRIAHAHIDIPVGSRRRFPRPDDGYDYSEYFRILNRVGMQRLSVEALHEETLLDGKESIAYMRRLLAETRE